MELGIWVDGRMEWSEKKNGTRMYFSAKLHTNTLREVVQKFDRKGYFTTQDQILELERLSGRPTTWAARFRHGDLS